MLNLKLTLIDLTLFKVLLFETELELKPNKLEKYIDMPIVNKN